MALDNIQSLLSVPLKLRTDPIYPKITAMLDHVINNALLEFEDVKYKYSGPDVVREEVVKNIITELGFGYITDIMDTITNFEFNILLEFVSLLNLLKGSRAGLELILKLLGFDSFIQEWWQQSPINTPDTYVITIIMNSTYVPDAVKTLDKVKAFARHYVYPTFSNIDFRFSLNFAELAVGSGGFSRAHYSGSIFGSIT